jgi:flagellar motor switch/type III secretory pathway protein FliN
LLTLTIVSFVRKIAISKLKNLKLGEIIIVMTKRHPINQPLVLIGNTITLHTRFNQDTLELLDNPTLSHYVKEINMVNQNDDINAIQPNQEESSNEFDLALNDYKVSVLFELNRLDMPVKDISKLSQGSIINLQKPITEDIFLTVSGRTIAIGEVVQIGQNFGVLIKEVLNG